MFATDEFYYNARKVCLSVCLSVCHPHLAPSLLHGRGPRPRHLSPLALGTCPHLDPHLPLRAAWGGRGWVAGSSFPADSVKFVSRLILFSFVATSGEWRPLKGPSHEFHSLCDVCRCHRLALAVGSVAPSARYYHHVLRITPSQTFACIYFASKVTVRRAGTLLVMNKQRQLINL